ncbi:MAG: prepilin-type N-terminal cleavage/methylation domain-containing protein, partial [Nitrospirae bacterium]|nr:prepilin-type N-terminal cleavage/methylation domain-containing protein [Nitrospirota bacterium]
MILKKEKGFTLIELVIVLVVLAIMAAGVNVLIGDTTSTKAYGTARKIQSDIIFAQESAMTHRVHYRVRFTSSTGYTVEQCSPSCWGPVIDPSTNTSPFVVTLNSGSYSGVTLDWPTGFTGNYIEFNSAGTPLDGST